jgi:hypothetical protein
MNTESIDRVMAETGMGRVQAINHLRQREEMQRFARNNRARIKAEWDALPDVPRTIEAHIKSHFQEEQERMVTEDKAILAAIEAAQIALWQYVSDLKYPPQGDSIDRRIAAANKAAAGLSAIIETECLEAMK